MSKENVLNEEAAELEFERFAEEMDIDIDPAYMDEDDKSGFDKQKRRLVKAIMNGSLIINENGEAVYTPIKSDNKDPMTFQERTGASIMAMDSRKSGANGSKMYAVMADMTNSIPGRFAKMKGIDIKTCEAIFSFLMD